MALKFVQFLALALTAIALIPAGAHLFALPNKIGLPQEQYLIVQGIYRGWALLGVRIVGTNSTASRRQGRKFAERIGRLR